MNNGTDIAGFRLTMLEVYNWGTFHKRLWRMPVDGGTSLLTGDTGKGKSTLVDALTTLLVEPARITYNKAAGAGFRERSPVTYFHGYYGNRKREDGEAIPRQLRGKNHYSVILARFTNGDRTVTLAQIFWLKPDGRLGRLYVAAPTEMSIAVDFSGFGDDMRKLRQRLRRTVTVFESFSRYGAEFRRLLGIRSPQAMELFCRTVSLKSVGNLTEFVRDHMLRVPETPSLLQQIGDSFDDLNKSWEAVVRARRQEELLAQGRRFYDGLQETAGRVGFFSECRDSLEMFFAARCQDLLEAEIRTDEIAQSDLAEEVNALEIRAAGLAEEETRLQEAVLSKGGHRLEQIDSRSRRLSADRQSRVASLQAWEKSARIAKVGVPADADSFREIRAGLQPALDETAAAIAALDEEIPPVAAERLVVQEELEQVRAEVAGLEDRCDLLPGALRDLRNALCAEAGIRERDIPFAGELIRVREADRAWQGPLESLLGDFALHMLVPERHARQFAGIVNRRHPGMDIRWLRAGGSGGAMEKRPGAAAASKLEVHKEAFCRSWLEAELSRRFPHICCEDIESFRRQANALSRQGQVRTNAATYRKDDRYDLSDARRYLLGWSNTDKREALQRQAAGLEEAARKLGKDLEDLRYRRRRLEKRRDACRDLLGQKDFASLDPAAIERELESLAEERQALETRSGALKTLNQKLKAVRQDSRVVAAELRRAERRTGAGDAALADRRRELEKGESLSAAWTGGIRERCEATLEEFCRMALGETALTPDNAGHTAGAVRRRLQEAIDKASRQRSRLEQKLVGSLQKYLSEFPLEGRELDASVAAAPEFYRIHDRLLADDLPRHEENFRQLLREGTIQDMALLQSRLDAEAQDIGDRISRINDSLREIPYNEGSFIRIVSDPNPDKEIRGFREELRRCLSARKDEGIYSEERFHQVKKLIDRFRGRSGDPVADERWTRRVTDVRNWYRFSASERWSADNTEREFYSDSSGKSGGQKEKLAYTILASALAFQYGLEGPGGFRFVMIDEAFGRGSDSSARYGLELFKKLDLQLLVITPLQKTRVIEDYVSSVHLVYKDARDRESHLASMTISAFRGSRSPVPDSLPPAATTRTVASPPGGEDALL